jgi:DNA-binding NarL/FixJ family response regulator
MHANEHESPPNAQVADWTGAHDGHRPDPAQAAKSAAGRIALVVDDDPFFRMALRAILTDRLGYSDVVEAASFDEALEQLDECTHVAIVLIDLAMPGMSGPANLKIIRETFPRTLVVMVSASSARCDVIQALQAGAHGYVPKGLGVAGMTAALRSILQGTIYVPAFLSDVTTDVATAEQSAPPRRRAADVLTQRQRDVLTRLMAGMSNKELARDLKLGEGTIKVHMAALFRNLGVKSRAAAAAVGARILQESNST